MTTESYLISIIGGLWTLVLFLAKNEISKMNKAIEELSKSLTVLSKDFYQLQGEHHIMKGVNLAT
jgi:hypothetical protein